MRGAMYKVADFLKLLMRPGAKLEMRAIKVGGHPIARSFADSATDAEKFGLRYGRNAEIYMGVAPRIGDKQYAPPQVLWADVDFKQTPEHTIRTDLLLTDIPPSVVIHSGGGLHLYWIINGKIENPSGRLRWLAWLFGGDQKSTDHARILRLPGTMNHKYAPPRMVTIETMDCLVEYEPWEFEELGAETVVKRAGYSGPTAGLAAKAIARGWIADREPAVEGLHGDDWTFQTACVLVRDYGLDEVDALELMLEWNEWCAPPWSEADLTKKIKSAIAYGRGEVGADDPEREFASIDVVDAAERGQDGGVEHSKMQTLTKRYRACIDSGRLRIYYLEPDDVLGREYWQSSSKGDFVDIIKCIEHMGVTACGTNKKGETTYEDTAVHWLECYREKETYRGLVYMPEHDGEKTPDGRLNIWRGFAPATKRNATTWELLKQVILESICSNNHEWYNYIMGWMAFAVQYPHIPAMVALVLRGQKGTGKSSVGSYFAKLFGRHGMHLTSQGQLTGRFNMHLRDISALFADEAFWAGSKEGEGVLKGLITEKTITYEGKGVNAEAGRNCVHLIMASNEEWVVPAGVNQERRFAVFDVQSDVRSRQFWAELHNTMEHGGGLAAMLKELKEYNLSKFEIRDIPQTEALAKQKLLTLAASEQWLVDFVLKKYKDDMVELRDGLFVTLEDLELSMERFYEKKRLHTHFNSTRTHIGMLLSRLLPKAKKIKIRTDNDERKWGYQLPLATEAKRYLEENLGLSFKDWEIVEEVVQGNTGLDSKDLL